MERMKDFCKKPSEAIRAMLDGMQEIPNGDFKLHMDTFGDYSRYSVEGGHKIVCFGCAATCTIQQATGKLFKFEPTAVYDVVTRSRYLHIDREDLGIFEHAIDDFRTGGVRKLGNYYGVSLPEPADFGLDWYMGTDDWQHEVEDVEDYLERIINLGF